MFLGRQLGMEDSGYSSRCPPDIHMCSTSDSAHSILNIKYSELADSKYSYFLYGFKDEQDFEDFKQDLRDFQKLKNECYGDVDNGNDVEDNLLDLKEELQFIRQPNDVCKERRKHTNKNIRKLCENPAHQSRSLAQAGFSSPENICPDYTKNSKDSSKLIHRPRRDRPDSCGQRISLNIRNSVFGIDAPRSSTNRILMEFMNGDEHFQEFERVYDTVNNRRVSRDMDTRVSSDKGMKSLGSGCDSEDNDNTSKNGHECSSRFVTDIFTDFFDNDETFLEFEKEFEKFRSSRRSNLLSLKSMGSSRDIFGDMQSYCERNMRSNSGSLVSVNSCSSQDEAMPSCGDESVSHDLIWRSVEDWEKMLRKMRRNSRLLLDACRPKYKHQHRHSCIGGHWQDGQQSDAYQKTQSLADLRRCHGDCDMLQSSFRDSPYKNRQRRQSETDVMQRSSSSSSEHMQKSSPDHTLDNSSLSDTLSNRVGDCSSEHWSESYENDNLYSSTSTLCSGNGDLSSSFSCSCCTDLHVEEDTDDDLLIDSQSPPSRARSHSLMELPSQARPNSLGLLTTSEDNLLKCNRRSRAARAFRNLRNFSKETNTSQSNDHTLLYLDDDTPTDDDDSIFGGNRWSRPPSTVSAQLSDAESEQYHTATSDLSDHYSTAKSDLSNRVTDRGHECKSRSLSFDHPGESCPVTDTSDRVHQWTNRGHCGSDDYQPLTRGQYNSYHGKEGRTKYTHNRPRSGSVCQYTCHQHCVPAVTLNCKSISDDGHEVARTPSPSDPQSLLETSLSSSNNPRPGCARIVPSISSHTANTTIADIHRVSESVPNFQNIPEEKCGTAGGSSSADLPDLSHEGAGAFKPSHSSAHHLSRSTSEVIVSLNSSHMPQSSLGSNSPSYSSGQHTSSQKCSPSHMGSLSGSLKQTTHIHSHTPTQSQLKTVLHNQQVDNGARDKIIQGDSSITNNNLSEHFDSSCDNTLDLPYGDANQEVTTEKDETDSGYRSGTIPDDKLPRVPSQATLDRQELNRKIAKYNHFVPAASLEMTGKESFQGFVKVAMNLIRPITMELGARPPSIYELLTREHIVEENTQQVAFYMPRDTYKSLHITSDTTTKEVVTSLLKKFHILDHPRKFAMYEQEFNDRNKLVRLRRLTDKDFPLRATLGWDPERIRNYRMVLQENETGEIVWDVFSLPELGNFLKVLDREEKETILELKHKYAYMKQYMERRLVELRSERNRESKS